MSAAEHRDDWWLPRIGPREDMDPDRFDVVEFHEVRVREVALSGRGWRARCKCGVVHRAWSRESAYAWADEHVGNT